MELNPWLLERGIKFQRLLSGTLLLIGFIFHFIYLTALVAAILLISAIKPEFSPFLRLFRVLFNPGLTKEIYPGETGDSSENGINIVGKGEGTEDFIQTKERICQDKYCESGMVCFTCTLGAVLLSASLLLFALGYQSICWGLVLVVAILSIFGGVNDFCLGTLVYLWIKNLKMVKS